MPFVVQRQVRSLGCQGRRHPCCDAGDLHGLDYPEHHRDSPVVVH